MSDDDFKGKAVKLFSEAKPVRFRRAPAQPARLSIVGDNNVQAGRDVHITTEKIVHKTQVHVVPGEGCITEAQKVRLSELHDEWVRLSSIVRKSPVTAAGAWKSINGKGGVTSYHLIPVVRFAIVEKWVLRQIALLNGTATARKRSPSWRTARIRAIQARCNEKGLQSWRSLYMLDRFKKQSMVELGDDELEALYRAVMAR